MAQIKSSSKNIFPLSSKNNLGQSAQIILNGLHVNVYENFLDSLSPYQYTDTQTESSSSAHCWYYSRLYYLNQKNWITKEEVKMF